MSTREMLTNELLQLVAEKTLAERYVPEFAKPETPEHLRDALGVAIASYCDWYGNRIIEIFLSALEDANYHDLYRVVEEYARENKILNS